jgi:nucleoside-diphosphate-sugar epimerase
MQQGRTIVLTGAAGVVGRAQLAELAGRPVIALTHREPVAGVDCLRCDITQPRLGLDPSAYRELADRADVIIHSAAQTDFKAAPESYARVNVDGVENMIGLARDADVPLYHISTAFIHGLRPDAPLTLPDDNLIVGYVRSKIEGERMLADSGVPHTVFRPPNLTGDARTGEIARPQILQLVCDFICRGKVPLFPAWPGARVDLVPQDLLARAVVAVLDACETGTDYWVTAGEEALTLAQIVGACTDLMQRIGQPIDAPRIVHPDDVDLDSPQGREGMSPFTRSIFAQLRDISDGMLACVPFPTSLAQLESRHGVVHGSFHDAYVRGVEWSAQEKGLVPVASGNGASAA